MNDIIEQYMLEQALNDYQEAYDKCKDMTRVDCWRYLDERNLIFGLCYYFGRHFDIPYDVTAIFMEEHKREADENYHWIPASTLYYNDMHPVESLLPRIAYLETKV